MNQIPISLLGLNLENLNKTIEYQKKIWETG